MRVFTREFLLKVLVTKSRTIRRNLMNRRICGVRVIKTMCSAGYSLLGPRALKAVLVGAKTVNGPVPFSVDTRPPAPSKVTSVDRAGVSCASWTIVLLGENRTVSICDQRKRE